MPVHAVPGALPALSPASVATLLLGAIAGFALAVLLARFRPRPAVTRMRPGDDRPDGSLALRAPAPAGSALEDTYARLFSGLPIGLFRVSSTGEVIDVNDTLVRTFRYPDRSSMIGKSTRDFYADPAERDRLLDKVITDGVVKGAEVLYRRYDGTTFWGRLNTRVVGSLDPGGALLEGTIEDIDEQKRVGAALREAEERYRDLVEMSPDGIIVHVAGRVVFTNEAGARLFGGTERGHLIGVQVMDLVAPEFREQVRARIQAIGKDGRPAPALVEKLQRIDGSTFMAEVVARPMLYNGSPAIQLVARDVTARMAAEDAMRQSEARFRALTENSWDAITVCTPQGEVLFRFPSVSAVPALHTPFGNLLEDLRTRVHPDDLAETNAVWDAVLAEPGRTATLQFRIRGESGYSVIESRIGNFLHNEAIRGIVINSRDLTDRVRLEEELRQAQKMEAIGRLAGGVAHDFNNILTAINGHTKLLLEDLSPTDPIFGDLAEIDRSAQRATALTRQLLALSRRQVLQPKLMDLNACVAEMESMLGRLIGEHISLATDLAPGLGLIRADPGQIEQIVLNLSLNARDAMPDGGEMVISTSNETIAESGLGPSLHLEPGSYVVLSVLDRGVGIPTAHLEHIFEPFFTTKELGKGTGLGLSVVYGIARQSGGTVTVESHPGAGTEFRVYLPRAEGTLDLPRPEEVDGASAASSARILLVEDEPAVRALAARVLARAGHRVTTAENGLAALKSLELMGGFPPDLLVTDVVMPGLSGLELVHTLRERFPDLRVLYVSGYSEEAVGDPARLEGNALFLEKPFSPEALRDTVQRMLRS